MVQKSISHTPTGFLSLALFFTLSYTFDANYLVSRFFPRTNIEIPVRAASVVPSEPEPEESELEKAAKACDFDTRWDEMHSAGLLRDSALARVILFGVDYDPIKGGDPRDGSAVAGALPYFQTQGWNYVAVEGPISLNQYVGTFRLEQEAQIVFGPHWVEYGPVITKAQSLGMRLVFFYDPRETISTESEQAEFERLKTLIFDKDPRAKVIVYTSSHCAFTHPTERSFIDPTKIKSLGTFLAEYFGDKLFTNDKVVIDILLQPERHRIWGFSFDHSFYLGKGCPSLHHPEEVPILRE
ncbi:TPA: hypothetical protein HA249_00870 [Candidatus Woesearchaeota archaeon]|nr:hypothetical protein [Candidatus Woesearchaeota archaeon]HIH46723.1 hypothetical protein [Candidatus Woesearchaeota archaeon]